VGGVSLLRSGSNKDDLAFFAVQGASGIGPAFGVGLETLSLSSCSANTSVVPLRESPWMLLSIVVPWRETTSMMPSMVISKFV
jgi:hypothetical protein